MTSLADLVSFLDRELRVAEISDYPGAVNGLQLAARLTARAKEVLLIEQLVGDFPVRRSADGADFKRLADQAIRVGWGLECVNHEPRPAFSCPFV